MRNYFAAALLILFALIGPSLAKGSVQVVNPPWELGWVNVADQNVSLYTTGVSAFCNANDATGYDGAGQVGEWVTFSTSYPAADWDPSDIVVGLFSSDLGYEWTPRGIIGVDTSNFAMVVTDNPAWVPGGVAFYGKSMGIPANFPIWEEVFCQYLVLEIVSTNPTVLDLKALSNISRVTTQPPLP